MEEDTELFEIDDEDMGEYFELSLVGQADTVRPLVRTALLDEEPLASPRKRSPLLAKSSDAGVGGVKEERSPSPRDPGPREAVRRRAPLQQLSPPPPVSPLRQPTRRREVPVPRPLSPQAERSGEAGVAGGTASGRRGLRVYQAATPPAPRAASLAEARLEERAQARDVRSGAKRRSSGPAAGEPATRRRAAELEYELSSAPDDAVSQKEEFMRDFRTGPWLAMLYSADLPPFDLDPSFRLNGCIGELRRQGTSTRPRGLVVLVKQLGGGHDNHPVLIKDPTGVMRGHLHPDVVKENEGKIGEGCVLVLANPSMLYLSEFSQFLSITSKNIVRVFSPRERIPAAYAALTEEQRQFDPCLAYRGMGNKAPAPPRTPRTRTPRRRHTDALGGSPYAQDSQLTPTALLRCPEETDELDAMLASIPDDELTPYG